MQALHKQRGLHQHALSLSHCHLGDDNWTRLPSARLTQYITGKVKE